MSIILAIETSCDETAVAVVRKTDDHVHILANSISSQIQLHTKHGGVVPNLAAREHNKNINHVLKQALTSAKVSPNDIDLLAVTNAPGLIPALLVGTSTARTLSWLWKKPLLGIHHIEGHIYANLASTEEHTRSLSQTVHFPLLALVVSGGHTQLVLMHSHFQYEIVGETQDDAVGEAFDKTARVLGLGYPGGPEISRHATIWRKKEDTEHKLQNTRKSDSNPDSLSTVNCSLFPPLPRPMLHSGDLNFSFSGLKTAVITRVKTYRREQNLDDNDALPADFVNAMSAEFEDATVDVLIAKTKRATKMHNIKTILLAGGVSANIHLKTQLATTIGNDLPDTSLCLPPQGLSLDNAVMIASAAALRYETMNTIERASLLKTWATLETLANDPLPSRSLPIP